MGSIIAPNPSYHIPTECKAGVVVNEGPTFTVKVTTVPVPSPGPNEVLMKLNATGLCYSDLHYCLGDMTGVPPMSSFGVRAPGHEGAGVVVKVGSNVTNFRVGDRAGLKPIWDTCGACDLCWGDQDAYCAKALYTRLAKPGTWQEYVVSPARYTSPIPDGVDDYTAGPIKCSATTIFRSISEARLKPGDWAVFPGGGGGVGIQGVQLAAAMGLRPIVVDTGKDKEELCLSRGAEAFVDFKRVKSVPDEVLRIADGIGAHALFVTAPAAYGYAADLIGGRIGGKVMCIGLREFHQLSFHNPHPRLS
jgi:alcohol dehydrogenase, propanol-preferring